jgi:hypothetical protein
MFIAALFTIAKLWKQPRGVGGESLAVELMLRSWDNAGLGED